MAEKKENTSRIDNCRFSHSSFFKDKSDGTYPVLCSKKKNADGEWNKINEETCEKCDLYKSRYMEFPLTINGIETKEPDYKGFLHQQGCLVKVRPCGEEYGKKTYLGFYLGDFPFVITHSFNEESGILKAMTIDNPAIFVPELGKIIWGCESWWGEIKDADDLKDITDEDINDVWYLKLAKHLIGEKKKEVEPKETEQP